MITEPSRRIISSPVDLDGDEQSAPAAWTANAASLAERIRQAEAQVTVIGLGYVGLPLALAFARAGFAVHGLDVDARKVADLTEGISYIDEFTDAQVDELVHAGRFQPSADAGVLRDADVVVICVPTPYTKTKQPDLT